MKRLIRSLLAVIGLSGCTKSVELSPAEFTREFADALRHENPELKIEAAKDLELTITTSDGHAITSFLHNAYNLYRQDPATKSEVMKKFIQAGNETLRTLRRQGVDAARIVPVVKDRSWLDEVRQGMSNPDVRELPNWIHDDLNGELVVFYAEDSPQNIRYLEAKDLAGANIAQDNLRQLACENLMRLLPKIERHGSNGVFMITAGGDYEASLLLIESIWADLGKLVDGDVVVAIPTRDLLLVTGSHNAAGIRNVRELADKAFKEGSYRLTTKLFTFRQGKLVEFRGGR